MERVVLALGSNLGDRKFYINEMIDNLAGLIYNISVSEIMETKPVGVDSSHSFYLNCLVSGFYDKSPFSLLDECEKIEIKLGRKHKGNLAPRTADIDIIFFGKRVIKNSRLVVPHHSVFSRSYVKQLLNKMGLSDYYKELLE